MVDALHRIIPENKLYSLAKNLRAKDQTIIWTNGCFDLMHAGHVRYLENARELGDVLLVGVNSDISINILKKKHRPFVDQQYRAMLVAALRPVDYVCIFDDPSPARILQRVKPEVFVKGDDYTLLSMDQTERKIIEDYGGKIVFVPGIAGFSTTTLVRRILNAHASL